MSLSKLQKAVAYAGLAAAPATAHAGVSDVTAAVKIDNHTKEGQSDARGDEKFAAIVLRTDDGKVLGLETGIYTPQFGYNRAARDTASLVATFGQEVQDGQSTKSIYGSIGYANGPVLDQWHNFVNKNHNGHARMSPASSDGRLVLGVAARLDEAITIAQVGNTSVDLNGAVFAAAGTTRVATGVAAFVSLNGGKGSGFRPNLPDTPALAMKGDYTLYAGITGTARIYDLATERLGTKLHKVTAVLGAAAALGPVHAGIEFQKDLTPEIERRNVTPVGRTMVRVGFDF